MAEQHRNPANQQIEFFVNDRAIKTDQEEMTVERILQQAGESTGERREAEQVLVELRGGERVEHQDKNERIRIRPQSRFEVRRRGAASSPRPQSPESSTYSQTVGQPSARTGGGNEPAGATGGGGGGKPTEGGRMERPDVGGGSKVGEQTQGVQRPMGSDNPQNPASGGTPGTTSRTGQPGNAIQQGAEGRKQQGAGRGEATAGAASEQDKRKQRQ